MFLVTLAMLGAGLPSQQLPWLQPHLYKLQLYVQVQVLLQLLNCCDNSVFVALASGIALLFALPSSCGAIPVLLPG